MVPEHIVDRSYVMKSILLIPSKASILLTDYDICAIDEAVFESSIGLYTKNKYWISLDLDMTKAGGRVIVIKFYSLRNDGDSDLNTKKLGKHFRNVTTYLRVNYPDIYERFKSGPRIFNYGMV